MGNCIRKGSSMEWGGEDWGSFRSGDKTRNHDHPYGNPATDLTKEKSLLGEGRGVLTSEGTVVKIKISKKEWEQMLEKADVDGLSVRQVLAQWMNGSVQLGENPRSWRPALQSIPE